MITPRSIFTLTAGFAAAGFAVVFAANAWARGGSSTVGVPNPASAFCVNHGGELALVDHDSWALCKIGDAMIEEWTLFRAASAHQAQTATDLFLGDGTVACADAGGEEKVAVVDADGRSLAYCQFGDRSIIESQTLIAGSTDGEFQAMRDLLTSGGDPQPVALDLGASAWLFAHLSAAHAPRDPVVGVSTFHVESLACGRVIYPGLPTTCALGFPALGGQAARTVTWRGAEASYLFDLVDAAVGRSDPAHVLGAAHVIAKNVACSIVVVPGAVPHCTLTKGD